MIDQNFSPVLSLPFQVLQAFICLLLVLQASPNVTDLYLDLFKFFVLRLMLCSLLQAHSVSVRRVSPEALAVKVVKKCKAQPCKMSLSVTCFFGSSTPSNIPAFNRVPISFEFFMPVREQQSEGMS